MKHLSVFLIILLPFIEGSYPEESDVTKVNERTRGDTDKKKSVITTYTNNTLHVFTSNLDGQVIFFRVINGTPASLGEIPYQVSMMRRISRISRKYSSFCGGSIIGPKKVLTAAHCVHVKKLSDCYEGKRSAADYRTTAVAAGQLRTVAIYGAEGQWRKIKSVKYPRKYKFPKNDIAVVYLFEQFTYNSYVKPINYASKHVDYGNKECLASGYGRTSESQYASQSPVLLKATLKVLSFETCNRIHRRDYSRFVCTSDTISDMRQGDSGGPLVCRKTGDPAEKGSSLGLLVGVVSGKDMSRTLSTFFTRVSSYYKFVNSATKTHLLVWPFVLRFTLFVFVLNIVFLHF